MGMSQNFCSLFTCEIRIIQVQNLDSKKSKGNLFARFYLPSGNNNKRIQLNTKKVHSKSFWNESFTLECSCPQEFLDTLKHEESLVLELRQSKKILGSSLVGKGEVPWKEILESPNMVYKEWVKMVPCKEEEEEAPKVEVEIKIQVAKEEEEKENNNKNNNKRFNYNWDECGCKKGHDHDHNAWCSSDDYDVFALGLTLEAF
ncbi:hypothetical protein PIB30_062665 [Stylosanthes scabra]|uniref:C2 domain-containing protein n=1 Tax=Stylosanthes scabra TaxID=79078 RepID=A0ABU6SM68_9FABA|nr:hypothetical protein [Stylosanthes scabra]